MKKLENKCDLSIHLGIDAALLAELNDRLKNNIPLLADIYAKRNEKAQLLGFPHHSGN